MNHKQVVAVSLGFFIGAVAVAAFTGEYAESIKQAAYMTSAVFIYEFVRTPDHNLSKSGTSTEGGAR